MTRIASVAASATPLSAAPTASATSAVSAVALASLAPGAPPTLADVARLAGVSAATASRVLSGSAHVQPKTRVKVEQAIARLGYVRNRAPRAVRSQQAGSIALVVGEENVKVFADPFFARILLSFGRELAEVDLQLVLLTLHTPRDYHMVARYLRSGHVDGAFFVSMHLGPGFDLAGLGIPVVLCGRPLSGGDGVSYVDADNVGGAKKAVNYLLGSGRNLGRDDRGAARHGTRHRPAARLPQGDDRRGFP